MLWFLSLLLAVTFPSVGVTAQTEQVHVADGQLGAPTDPDALGVYQLPGNLLLVGHVDWAGQLRVGSAILGLQNGDPIELSDGRSYHVTWAETFDIDDDQGEWAQAIAPGDDELTLITCTGPYSRSRQEYLQRVVVRAERDR
jgi:sortase (surface protein transpeptidase)